MNPNPYSVSTKELHSHSPKFSETNNLIIYQIVTSGSSFDTFEKVELQFIDAIGKVINHIDSEKVFIYSKQIHEIFLNKRTAAIEKKIILPFNTHRLNLISSNESTDEIILYYKAYDKNRIEILDY